MNSGDFGHLVRQAREEGFDTLQFTHRCEDRFKYEVLDVRGTADRAETGSKVCRHRNASAAAYRSGWGGRRSCECTETDNACTNCLVRRPDRSIKNGRE